MPEPSPASSNSSLNPSPSALRPGDKIDPYTIKRQIGSGGNSVVYQAEDELLGKQVAIKQFIFSGAQDETQLRDKVMKEAKLHQRAAEADPAMLVQVIDVTDSPQGLLLISEYIDGPSLEQILAQNTDPMNLKQALGIVAAAAKALDAIHGQGIVHLDLKPANILMPRSGGLKISDFGLASNLNDQAPPTTGTVRYMAPELLNDEKVDGRADLYALGIMAYEMIAGRTKFDQAFKLILRDQRNQAVRWVKWHTNPRTQAAALAKLVPDTPQQVSDLVASLMQKDPARRVGSAKDLLKAIKRHCAGKSIGPSSGTTGPIEELASETTTPGDTKALPTRSHAVRYGITAAVAVLLLAIGAGLFTLNQDRIERKRVLDDARQTMEDAKAAYRDKRFDAALSLFDEVAQNEAVRETYGVHAQAGALLSRGQMDAEALRYDEAIRLFNQAADLGESYRDKAKQLVNETHQTRAFDQTLEQIDGLITERSFGLARSELDRWRDLSASEEERQKLLALGARLEDQLARWRVQELIREANDLTQRGRRADAIGILKTGPPRIEVTELLARLEAEEVAEQAVARAKQALNRGDREQAIAHYEEAVEALPDDTDLRERLTDLRSSWLVDEGLRMLAEGNVIGADQMLTEALGYQPENARARSALAQIASSNRREAFIEAGDAAAAEGDYETALHQYDNALQLGVDDPLGDKMAGIRIQILLKQSRAFMESGQIDQAGDLVTQARQLDPENPDVAAARREIEVRGEYLRHLNAGNDARSRSAFGDAKRHYLRARAAMDTPQIRALLDETEFDHLLAQARNYIAAKEYTSARAQLRIAAKIKLTEEVRELLERVEAEDNGQSP